MHRHLFIDGWRHAVTLPIVRGIKAGAIALTLFFALSVSASAAADVAALRQKAEQGDAAAQYGLCVAYFKGKGLAQDDRQAFEWCHKAAKQGYARAQFRLGAFLSLGKGARSSQTEAVYWFQKAAEQGYPAGQSALGTCYKDGIGIAQDKARAAYRG